MKHRKRKNGECFTGNIEKEKMENISRETLKKKKWKNNVSRETLKNRKTKMFHVKRRNKKMKVL